MRTFRSLNLLAVAALMATLVLGSCSSSGDDKADSDKTTTTTKAADGDDEATTTTEEEKGDETTTTRDDGGDVEVSGDGQAFVDAMVESMQSEEDFPLSEDQARCFAARTVNTIGVDRLNKAGVTPEQFGSSGDSSIDFSDLGLTEDDANEIFDNFGRCDIDLREMMLESMAADSEVSAGQKACMETVLTDENLRKLMVTSFMKGDDGIENDPELEEVMGGIMGCAFMGMGEGMGMGEDTSTTAPATTAAG